MKCCGPAAPAIAVAGRGRTPALLRGLLRWAGLPAWRVCPLDPGAARSLTVVSPGDLSWELVARCVTGGPIGLAVLDLDDPISRYWQEAELTPCLTYSENKDRADLTAKNLTVLPDGGLRFEAVSGGQIRRVRLAKGTCTLYQALDVMACALAAGVPLERSAAYLSGLPDGRESG
jgi:hypothetical protein